MNNKRKTLSALAAAALIVAAFCFGMGVGGNTDTEIARAVSIDRIADTVCFEDYAGRKYTCDGAEDWAAGDYAILTLRGDWRDNCTVIHARYVIVPIATAEKNEQGGKIK